MSRMTRYWHGLAVLLSVLLLGVVFPSGAEAAGCGAPGSLIRSFPIVHPSNGVVLARLDVYYSRAYGGTNSACVHHAGVTWGVPLATQVDISSDGGDADSDGGTYRYFAGPARVTGTRYRCVMAEGYIDDPYNRSYVIKISAQRVGCGVEPRTATWRIYKGTSE